MNCLEWNGTQSIPLQKTENGLPCSVNIFPQDTYILLYIHYDTIMFLTIRGIYTQLFENNQQKLKLLEEWQFYINCHFLVMERKHIYMLCMTETWSTAMHIHKLTLASVNSLCCSHNYHTQSPYHTSCSYIHIVGDEENRPRYIKKKGVSTVKITEGINELNTYSNDISPTQLKTELKLQISQLQPSHCHLSKSYTIFSQILQFKQEIPLSLSQKMN